MTAWRADARGHAPPAVLHLLSERSFAGGLTLGINRKTKVPALEQMIMDEPEAPSVGSCCQAHWRGIDA